MIGDAAVAVNPIHSHGMSVAARCALRLDEELTRHGGIGPALFPGLQSALAAEAEQSWRMAVEADGERAGAGTGEWAEGTGAGARAGTIDTAGAGAAGRAGAGAVERAGAGTGRDDAPRRAPNAFEREIRTRLAQAKLSSPRIAAGLFAAQTLLSDDTATDRPEIARVLTGRPEPLLTSEEAIGQYPGLAAWLRSRLATATP